MKDQYKKSSSKSLADTIYPDWQKFKKSNSLALLKKLKKFQRTPLKEIRKGHICYMLYTATTVKEWDGNPVILIFAKDKTYTYGLNINWLDLKTRKQLFKYLTKKKFIDLNRVSRYKLFSKLAEKYKIIFKKYLNENIKNNQFVRLSDALFYECLSTPIINVRKIKKSK